MAFIYIHKNETKIYRRWVKETFPWNSRFPIPFLGSLEHSEKHALFTIPKNGSHQNYGFDLDLGMGSCISEEDFPADDEAFCMVPLQMCACAMRTDITQFMRRNNNWRENDSSCGVSKSCLKIQTKKMARSNSKRQIRVASLSNRGRRRTCRCWGHIQRNGQEDIVDGVLWKRKHKKKSGLVVWGTKHFKTTVSQCTSNAWNCSWLVSKSRHLGYFCEKSLK